MIHPELKDTLHREWWPDRRRQGLIKERRRMWTPRNHLNPNSWHLFLNVVVKEDSEHSAVSALKIHISSLLLTSFTLPSPLRQKQWRQGVTVRWKRQHEKKFISTNKELDAQIPRDGKNNSFLGLGLVFFTLLFRKKTTSSGQPLTFAPKAKSLFPYPCPTRHA